MRLHLSPSLGSPHRHTDPARAKVEALWVSKLASVSLVVIMSPQPAPSPPPSVWLPCDYGEVPGMLGGEVTVGWQAGRARLPVLPQTQRPPVSAGGSVRGHSLPVPTPSLWGPNSSQCPLVSLTPIFVSSEQEGIPQLWLWVWSKVGRSVGRSLSLPGQVAASGPILGATSGHSPVSPDLGAGCGPGRPAGWRSG